MTISLSSPNSSTASIQKNGGDVITFDANNNATFAGTVVSGSAMGMRNRIINGDMRIDQRNAGASVTNSAGGIYVLDRMRVYGQSASKFSIQQSTDTPANSPFVNSMLITSLASTTPASTDYYFAEQRIEGFNIADFRWGTANAATVTLSFWVKSSLTGTFGGALSNSDYNLSYPFSYTISSANTWEQKTITIAGPTSGTWATTNGLGIRCRFLDLGTGSAYIGTANSWQSADYYGTTGDVKLISTNGATFYITGVQLEVGSTATPFEQRLYGNELQLCQRYYTKFGAGYAYTSYGAGYATSATSAIAHISYPVSMRTQPTSSLSGSNRIVFSGGSTVVSGFNLGATGVLDGYFTFTSSGMTTNLPCIIGPNGDTTAYLDLSAEL